MIASIFLRRQSRLDAYGGHTIYFDLHLSSYSQRTRLLTFKSSGNYQVILTL